MSAERVQNRIRVVIADDHDMFRQGIKEMLGTTGDIEVVGEARNGEEAISVALEENPEVILLDLEMPVMDAEEAMQQILEAPSPPEIVIVTMHDEPRLVRRLLGRGATSYLVKSASLDELVTAVRNASATYRNPEEEVVTVPLDVLENLDDRANGLSERELEVLLQAARGMSNRQIATSLHLSEATVKRHLANIYAKIRVNSRSEAVRKAMSEGWITAYEIDRKNNQ